MTEDIAMKIHTKLVYDFKTGALLEDEHYEHVGEVVECKGDVGGDGGAQARQDAEDARVAAAVQRINEVFGTANATPKAVDRNQFNVTEELVSGGNTGIGPIFGSAVRGQEVWQPSSSNNNRKNIGINENIGIIGHFGRDNNNRQTRNRFDETGYNAAVASAQSEADKLKGVATGRESLYSTIGADTTNKLMTDLNKERGLTERELNFNLARNGLSGGSRDIDSNREVLDTFNQGTLRASEIGRQTSNNARIADDGTRTDLISRVRAGLDEGSALQQSYEGLRNNAASARDDANSQSLNGFFSTIRNELDKQQYQQGVQQANTQFQNRNSPNKNGRYGGNIQNVDE